MARYDVFLSYNKADKPAVDEIARQLVKAGLQPWLDAWNLIPGDPWQEAIEEALNSCTTCAVFVGPSGTGPWQNEEMRAAIDRRVSEGKGAFRVIPVLLPGAQRGERSKLPTFLVATTWVEFRQTLDDADAFHRLVSGIRGQAPGPGPGQAIFEGVCPYRGLQFFDVQHAPFFFGREALTEWLLDELRGDNRFLAIVGPSGSGKSSLARAGLVAALKKGRIAESDQWPVVIARPGTDPLESLAVALSEVTGTGSDPVATLNLIKSLREDERTLHLTASLLLRSTPPEQRLVILEDQFEELFTLCHDDNLQQALINNLTYAAGVSQGRTAVVLAFRADFYGRCALYPRLAEALSDHQVLVGPMTNDELRLSIEHPAQLVGLEFEPGLVDVLLRDVQNQPGNLPLLQHALLELWERHKGRRLTHADYEAIGGVEGALEQRAEAIYTRFTESEQGICRRVFLRLTQPGEGTEDTKRRASLDELLPAEGEHEKIEKVIQVLAGEKSRLIVTESESAAERERFVEVSHEALIRNWGRLREWIEQDRAALRTHRRLTEVACEWDRNGRDESYLYSGARLAEAEEWAETHINDLNKLERAFLTSSVATREAVRRAERRRAYQVIGGLLTALLIISALAVMAFRQLKVARDLQKSILANELTTNVENLIGKDNELALLLAVEAVNLQHTFDTENALRQSLRQPTAETILKHPGLRVIAFAPDGSRIVTGGDDTLARVWSWSEGQELTTLAGHSNWIVAVDFSPDGERIVTASTDGTARLWDAATGMQIAVLLDQTRNCYPGDLPCRVWQAKFSPNGVWIATSSADGSVSLWDGVTGAWIGALPTKDQDITSIAFIPNDDQIVTMNQDGKACVWDIEEKLAKCFGGYDGQIWRARFSADGKRLVIIGMDRSAVVWDAESENVINILGRRGEAVLEGTEGPYVQDARFSRDNRLIITTGNDGTARIWDVKTGYVVAILKGHQNVVRLADFDSQGERALTVSSDGTARVWDVSTGDEILTYTGVVAGSEGEGGTVIGQFEVGGDGVVTAGTDGSLLRWSTNEPAGDTATTLSGSLRAYSSDGKLLWTTEYNTVHIWETSSWAKIMTLQGGDDIDEKIGGPSFSPDGSQILTGYGWLWATMGYNHARLWDVTTGNPIATFGEFVGSVEFNADGSLILGCEGVNAANQLWQASTLEKIPLPVGYVADLCGRILVITDNMDPSFYLWNGSVLEQIHTSARLPFSCSSDGKLLAVSDVDDQVVRVLDTRSGDVLATLQGERPTFAIEGTYIATILDRGIWIWNAATGKVKDKVTGNFEDMNIILTLVPKAKSVVIIRDWNQIQVWDVNQGEFAFTLPGFPIFSPDGQRIATISHDPTQIGAPVKIWDTSTGQVIAILGDERQVFSSPTFSPDGKYLLTSRQDFMTQVWFLNLEDLLELAHTKTTRSLTCQERQTYLHEAKACLSDDR